MCGSARDVSLIVTDRKLTYTELTEVILKLRGSVYCAVGPE